MHSNCVRNERDWLYTTSLVPIEVRERERERARRYSSKCDLSFQKPHAGRRTPSMKSYKSERAAYVCIRQLVDHRHSSAMILFEWFKWFAQTLQRDLWPANNLNEILNVKFMTVRHPGLQIAAVPKKLRNLVDLMLGRLPHDEQVYPNLTLGRTAFPLTVSWSSQLDPRKRPSARMLSKL